MYYECADQRGCPEAMLMKRVYWMPTRSGVKKNRHNYKKKGRPESKEIKWHQSRNLSAINGLPRTVTLSQTYRVGHQSRYCSSDPWAVSTYRTPIPHSVWEERRLPYNICFYITNIPKSKSKEEILEAFKKHADKYKRSRAKYFGFQFLLQIKYLFYFSANVANVTIHANPDMYTRKNGRFCLADFIAHNAASEAKLVIM